jgi:hypothetical protein
MDGSEPCFGGCGSFWSKHAVREETAASNRSMAHGGRALSWIRDSSEPESVLDLKRKLPIGHAEPEIILFVLDPPLMENQENVAPGDENQAQPALPSEVS